MATVVESSRSSTPVPGSNANNGDFRSPKIDIEAQQTTACSEETSQSTSSRDIISDHDLQDNSNVPRLSLPRLFWFFFYNFGLFAWGGPVAQISLLKEHLVLKEKWITVPRFQRVFAVYQILPGPEAAELCMFFGCLSAGRLGGIVAGIAFILPGFLLMLLASYLYSLAGLENIYFNASFRAIQPIVSAMVSTFWTQKHHLLTTSRSFEPHTRSQTTLWSTTTLIKQTPISSLLASARP
jgi:chromate transport protein ChrA